jgi:hypothetical protein
LSKEQVDKMVSLQNGKFTKWQVAKWQVAKWQVAIMTCRQNAKLAKCQADKITN